MALMLWLDGMMMMMMMTLSSHSSALVMLHGLAQQLATATCRRLLLDL
jgi:hypothetical protein